MTVIAFLQVLGPSTHILTVCQPCVAVLAAVAIMREDSNRAQPRSMTLITGPIFMGMNLDRHLRAQIGLLCHLANGEDEKAEAIRAF